MLRPARTACTLALLGFGSFGVACSSTDAAPGNGVAGSSAGANGAGANASGDAEPPAQMGMTAAHNAARAAVSPAASPAIPALAWSSELAATAQAWADGCKFEHSSGKYGENLYASGGANTTPEDVVASWVGEAKDYDYAANSCSGVCGHYTQVVWRKSTKLGCGVSNCSTNSPFSGFPEWQIWVCNYDPPGNFNGEKPY